MFVSLDIALDSGLVTIMHGKLSVINTSSELLPKSLCRPITIGGSTPTMPGSS